MKKILIFLVFLLLLSPVYAWKWENHEDVIELIYHSLPLDLQNKLDLDQMKVGSIAPDKDFKDTVTHHYPPSYIRAEKYLNLTRAALNVSDYRLASYYLGVASHYIEDSFVAPHYISKEPVGLHTEFESQVANYKLKKYCDTYDYDLNQSMANATENKNDWYNWLNSKDKKIPSKELDQATQLMFAVALNTLNTTCIKESNIITGAFVNDVGYPQTIAFVLLAAVAILIIILLIRKRKFKSS